MPIDIIVPIYNARAAVTDCLESLETHAGSASIILIDDASSDAEIAPLLRSFAHRNGWQLLAHTRNLGFVATANEGLRYSSNDTLLLNSDTLVTTGWLDRFEECRQAVHELATATPFSNNATICSFPRFMRNNRIPADIDTLAGIIHASHTPVYPELPTAVGFCMLVTQQAIDRIGVLDEATFGKGYGEENDFSMRAAAAGMKNVLCDSAYIAHVGNCSFSEIDMQPDKAVMQRVLAKHPEYMEEVMAYIRANPLMALRQQIMHTLSARHPGIFREIIQPESMPGE